MRAELKHWLIARVDPSIRLRVLTELLERPSGHPDVVAARDQIGREGWAASILSRQFPAGQWTTPSTEPGALYRPVYAATNSQLILLSDLGATRNDKRVAKGAELLLRQWGGPSGARAATSVSPETPHGCWSV